MPIDPLAVTEDQRTDLDGTIARLLDRGALIETKKHTYLKMEGS